MAQLGRTAAHVAVEAMRRRHLRQVLAIEQDVYPRAWSPQLFASELDAAGRCYLVARGRVDGRRGRPVLGYAGIMVAATEAHITTVAVHPAHHRRKVASHLLTGILTAAVGMGAHAATLEVRAANRGAQRLYGLFGFVPVGVRPGYYAETDEDAVIMWAHDVQGESFLGRLEAQQARLGEPGGASGAPDLHVPWVRDRVGLDDPDRERG